MPKIRLKRIHLLKQQIATRRQKMMDLWETRGFTDAQVLAASIELDKLLNIYEKIVRDK